MMCFILSLIQKNRNGTFGIRFNHNSFENDVQALSFQKYFDIRHVVAPVHEVLHAKAGFKILAASMYDLHTAAPTSVCELPQPNITIR
jgi:hypothetical protein